MRAFESFIYQNQGPSTLGPFKLNGGNYQFTAVGTWGGGNATLQELGPDQTTWLQALTPLTANGGEIGFCQPGEYRIVITTATGVSVSIVRIPGE